MQIAKAAEAAEAATNAAARPVVVRKSFVVCSVCFPKFPMAFPDFPFCVSPGWRIGVVCLTDAAACFFMICFSFTTVSG